MLEEKKDIIENLDERFSKDRNGFFLDYVADDIRWNIIGKSVIVGKDNFIKAMRTQELVGINSDGKNYPVITIKNIIIEGEYVIVESTGKAVTKDGKPYNPAYCDIYRLKDGKIQELTTYVVENYATNL